MKSGIKKEHIKKYLLDVLAQAAIFMILTQVITEDREVLFGDIKEVVHWELVVPVMVLFILANILVRKNFDFNDKD